MDPEPVPLRLRESHTHSFTPNQSTYCHVFGGGRNLEETRTDIGSNPNLNSAPGAVWGVDTSCFHWAATGSCMITQMYVNKKWGLNVRVGRFALGTSVAPRPLTLILDSIRCVILPFLPTHQLCPSGLSSLYNSITTGFLIRKGSKSFRKLRLLNHITSSQEALSC